MKNWVKNIAIYWNSNFLRNELILSIILMVIFVISAVCFHNSTLINQTISGNRGLIYTAGSTIYASLFGFVIAAISISLGFMGNSRLDVVRDSNSFEQLWSTFTSAIRALGLATITAIAGLIFDRDTVLPLIKPHTISHYHHVTLGQYILYLCIFTTILSLFRICRCIWILEKLIKLITKKSAARSGE